MGCLPLKVGQGLNMELPGKESLITQKPESTTELM